MGDNILSDRPNLLCLKPRQFYDTQRPPLAVYFRVIVDAIRQIDYIV